MVCPLFVNALALRIKQQVGQESLVSIFLALPYLSFEKTVLVCVINLIQAHARLFTGRTGLSRDFGGKVTVSDVYLAGRTACAKLYLCRAVPLKILGPVL